MTKSEIILELKKQGVVAVIRGYSFEEGYQASKACIQVELKAIEVAYTNNSANEIIKQLNKDYINKNHILIGAGSVLEAETARLAIISGTKYIVPLPLIRRPQQCVIVMVFPIFQGV